MPVFLGIQYPDLPIQDPVSNCDIYQVVVDDSPYVSAVTGARNFGPLVSAVTNALAEYNITAGRDLEPEFTLSDVISAVSAYDLYIKSFTAYSWQMNGLADGALTNPAVPANNFGAIFHSNYSQGFGEFGSCGYTRRYVRKVIKPYLKLQIGMLEQIEGLFEWVFDAIEAFQEDVLSATNLNNMIQEAYAQSLELTAENEEAERAIQQGEFLRNVSQLSLLGAAVVFGASQTNILK